MVAGVNTGTSRSTDEFLELYADYKPAHSSNRQLMRDFAESLRPTLNAAAVTSQRFAGGAPNNARHTFDAAMVIGNPTLTSASAAFTPADVGKTVMVQKATSVLLNLVTTVLAYISPTQVTLAANAGVTVNNKFMVLGTIATAAVQAAAAAGANRAAPLDFPEGSYLLDDTITLTSYQTVRLAAGVRIYMITPEKNHFTATAQTGITINALGAELWGEGSWLSTWAGGMVTHQDRAFHFLACTNTKINFPTLKNFGSCGIAIIGGDAVITAPHVEGTHNYSTPISANGNNQVGVYASNDPVYGSAVVTVIGGDISYTTQGVLHELQVGAPDIGRFTYIGTRVHDIPGQHAYYNQCSNFHVTGVIHDIHLSGVKVQSGNAGLDIKNFTANVVANNVGSNVFEIAVIPLGLGSVSDLDLVASGDGNNVGFGISGGTAGTGATYKIRNLTGRITLTNTTAYAAILQSDGMRDIDLTIHSQDNGWDGVLVTATNAIGIKLRPTLREPNSASTASGSGIRVASASADIDVYDADITDANTRMQYGAFNSVAGSVMRFHGSVKMTGALLTAVRATGVITEWPTESTLSGVNGPYTSLGNISSSQTRIFTAQSVGAANVTIMQQTLPDLSSYLVQVTLTGKLSTSAERRTVVLSGTFFRNGAGATLQGGLSVVSDNPSGGFAGVYGLVASGNDFILRANSGGVATYDWKARVTVTALP